MQPSSPNETPIDSPGAELAKLTRRQIEIAQMWCRTLSEPDIARALKLSEKTVSCHIQAVYKRLNVHSKFELFTVFRRLGLLTVRKDDAFIRADKERRLKRLERRIQDLEGLVRALSLRVGSAVTARGAFEAQESYAEESGSKADGDVSEQLKRVHG